MSVAIGEKSDVGGGFLRNRLGSVGNEVTRGFCLRWAYLLGAILQLSSPMAFAQGYDYYAPRTDNADITRLKNVEDYHLGPGQAKVAKREYHYAQQEFNFILNYYPNHPQALSLLSDLCQKSQVRTCDADARFEKGIQRNPNVFPTHLLHGMHLHRKKQMEPAVKAYRRALELSPESVDVHYNLGLAYVELKQYDLANQHAQAAYQKGAYTPGLRRQLEKVGKWNPNVSPPASVADSSSASDAKRTGAPEPKAAAKPALATESKAESKAEEAPR